DLREAVEKWIAGGKLGRLVELWTKGLEVDWRLLYGSGRPRRMSLPTYPFAKERYWIDASIVRPAPAQVGVSRLHPLLHENTSDLDGQRYTSRFRGDEPLLRDYRILAVDGERCALPPMAFLEMARAAVEHAQPVREAGSVLELRDVAWAQPLAIEPGVDGGTRVDLRLQPSRDGVDYDIVRVHGDAETIHAQGTAHVVPAPAQRELLDLGALRARMGRGTLSAEAIQAQVERSGSSCGAALRTAMALHAGTDEALIELRLPVGEAQAGDALSPALLEGALQGAQAWLSSQGEDRLPFAVSRVRLLSPCVDGPLAWVRRASGDGAATEIALDVDLCDAQGRVCVELRGCVWRTVQLPIPESVQAAEPVANTAIPAGGNAAVVPGTTAASPTVDGPRSVAASAPRAIAFLTPAVVVASSSAQDDLLSIREKPTGIPLAALDALPVASPPAPRPPVILPPLADIAHGAGSVGSAIASAISLHDCGDGH
ncbi:MAG: polyketide synthase dehydratase domain-containing protein, partial [Pseudomonadota bacterium]